MCDHTEDIRSIRNSIADINKAMYDIAAASNEAKSTSAATHALTARLTEQYDEHVRMDSVERTMMWEKINDLLRTKSKLIGIVTVIGAIVAAMGVALQDAVGRLWHLIFR